MRAQLPVVLVTRPPNLLGSTRRVSGGRNSSDNLVVRK